MSMMQAMDRVAILARHGFGANEIIATGIALNPATVSAIVWREFRPPVAPADVQAPRRKAISIKALCRRYRQSNEWRHYKRLAIRSVCRTEYIAKEAARDVGEILDEVAARHQITAKAILAQGRQHAVVVARHDAMYEMALCTRLSLTEISVTLGLKDHSTVIFGIRRHCSREGIAMPRGMVMREKKRKR